MFSTSHSKLPDERKELIAALLPVEWLNFLDIALDTSFILPRFDLGAYPHIVGLDHVLVESPCEPGVVVLFVLLQFESIVRLLIRTLCAHHVAL